MPTLNFILTDEVIPSEDPEWNGKYGAEVIFWGVVRSEEDGDPIAGIEYSAYRELAEQSIKSIATEAEKIFGEHRTQIVHRTGFVGAAEPSVVLRVGCCHSQSAFDVCFWYLEKIKTALPIWKKIILEEKRT